MYSNLKFFDKNGHPFRFTYDDVNDKWAGSVYFGIVSQDLIENLPIYVMESVYVNGEPTPLLKYPCINLNENYWYLEFDKNENYVKNNKTVISNLVPEIFLYTFNRDSDGNDYINKEYTQYVTLEEFQVSYSGDQSKKYVDTTIEVNVEGATVSVIKDLKTTPLTINVAFQPTKEDPTQNTLYIKEQNSGKVIAEITLYGEGETEDERMRDMLINLGHDLLPEDSMIFASSDVKEEFVDWKLINKKRKELLLGHSEIFPYTGSYKALINILKFYGYKNIKMKEYWQNVDAKSKDFGKYKQISIDDLFVADADPIVSDLIDSKIYKKTNKMSLCYDITVESGEFDTEGLPYTKETFSFSQEEILVKLFALKKKLQKYFLPLNSRIVDIIGEAIYFGLYNVSFATSENKIDDIQVGVNPVFEVYPTKNYFIEDLRYLGQISPDGILTQTQINQVFSVEKTLVSDQSGIQVGCPIILTNNTFDLTFDDLKLSYNQLLNAGSTGSYENWDNIMSFEHIELKWNISLNGSEKTYEFEKTSSLLETVTNNNIIGVVLPYTGSYDVTLTIVDGYNNSTFTYKKNLITVNSYESDFIGWYKKIDPSYLFDTKTFYKRQSNLTPIRERQIFGDDLNWYEYTSIWERPIHPNEPLDIAEMTYECLNSINFYENLENELTDKNIGYFDYSFNSIGLNVIWDDSYHLDWNSSGARGTQWRLSDFVDYLSDYHKITIESRGSSNSILLTSTLLSTREDYFVVLNVLKNAGEIFNDFAYFLVEPASGKPDIYVFSKNSSSPERYVIKYQNTIGATAVIKNPYYTNYFAFVGDTPGHFEIYDIIPGNPIEITITNIDSVYNQKYEYSVDYSYETGELNPYYSYQPSSIYSHTGYSTFQEFFDDITNPTNQYAREVFAEFDIYPTYDALDNLVKIQFIQNKNNYIDFYKIETNENIIASDFLININKNVSYNDIRILKYSEQLPILTNVHFCYDNSKIPGKTNQVWVLSKNDDSTFDDIYYRNKLFSYTFTQKGSYNLSLYLEDTNGNNNIITKTEFIKII